MGGDETSDGQASAGHETGNEPPDPRGPPDADTGANESQEGFDLKGIVRQLTAPMIESLDTRLRDQIEAHVDELLTEKVDAALAARLSTVDRAIADLSRSLEDLERRLGSREREGTSGDDAG